MCDFCNAENLVEEEEDKLRDECGVAGIFLNPKEEQKEPSEKKYVAYN